MGVEVERSPRMREIGVRSPVATDLSRKKLLKTGSDSSTSKRSALGVSVTGPRRCPCRSGCGTLKNPHCSMAMSAEHRSKFAALYW